MTRPRPRDVAPDRRARILELLPEIAEIGREAWREAVIAIWDEAWQESAWDDPADCPKSAKEVHDVSNVQHTRNVTRQALLTADVVEASYGAAVDRDVLLTGALLHDVSKMLESDRGPDGVPRPNRTGALVQHGVLAAAKAHAHGLPDEVIHILVCHTHQSATVPATNEAIIVHYVDFLDSDVLLLQRDKTLFAKRR
jgi:putative nucleotidyltransferase with HDIG domain